MVSILEKEEERLQLRPPEQVTSNSNVSGVGGQTQCRLNELTYQLTVEFQFHNYYNNNKFENKLLNKTLDCHCLFHGVRGANHPLATYLSVEK